MFFGYRNFFSFSSNSPLFLHGTCICARQRVRIGVGELPHTPPDHPDDSRARQCEESAGRVSGESQSGDTAGRHSGETQRGDTTGRHSVEAAERHSGERQWGETVGGNCGDRESGDIDCGDNGTCVGNLTEYHSTPLCQSSGNPTLPRR